MSDTKTGNHPASLFGKTYPVCYPPRTTHSDTFWLDWFKSVSHYNQQGENGQTLVMCIQPELSLGESSMLNTSVSPNAAKECFLWQVLEQEVSPKYSLSKKACEGILRRAETRGKVLPDLLKAALERIANPSKPERLERQGGALSGGSETLVVHGTQDPIVSNKAHCLGRNGGQENVLFDVAERRDGARIYEGVSPTLTAKMGTGGGNVPCIALARNTIGRQPENGGNGNGFDESGVSYTLTRTDVHAVSTLATVRKLTPKECERLQGFPDDWTKIPYRGKSADECPDSPRYKAIGNSMATPCMRWIGQRLNNYLTQSR